MMSDKKPELDIHLGELLLVCGISGSGKTTLLNSLKEKYGLRAGFVSQDVDENIVTDKVWHELAFGLENMGCSQEYIRRKTAEMTSFFGLSDIYRKRTTELSGGQKQLVLLASVMAAEPDILLLDEPTAQLDPISAEKLLAAVGKIHRELGTTIVIAEHRFSELLGMADRMAVCEDMHISFEGSIQETCEKLFKDKNRLSASLPAYVRMYYELGGEEFFAEPLPLDIAQGRRLIRKKETECREWFEKQLTGKETEEKLSGKETEEKLSGREIKEKLSGRETEEKLSGRKTEEKLLGRETEEPAVKLKNISLSYDRQEVLRDLSLSLEKGKITALLGANGAGKSSILQIIAGINEEYAGKVCLSCGKISYLPQNPRTLFLKESIGEEMEYANKRNKNPKTGQELEEIYEKCGINDILSRHPYDVSGGEIQRAAIAKSLIADPDMLLLDEPTKGMETAFRSEFGALLSELVSEGKTIVIASHDLDFALLFADECALVFDGEISVKARAREFFEGNTFYTGELMRLFGEKRGSRVANNRPKGPSGGFSENPEKTITKELPGGLAGNPKKITTKELPDVFLENPENPENNTSTISSFRLPIILTLICVLIAMPLTVFVGSVYLDNRKYFFISLLVMVELMIPAYAFYEAKKPKAIEIVVLATLTALTVTGRVMFYMLPTIKPVIALVMLSGLAFGPLSGMMVGASSMLLSNIFFRQGPWTPWQMFTFALIGLLSGFMGRNEKIKNNLPLVCAAGVFMTLVIFGGIMNPASVIMYEPDFNGNMILTAYATGFPYDLISAAFTAVFLFVGTKPMLKKCERVKRYL